MKVCPVIIITNCNSVLITHLLDYNIRRNTFFFLSGIYLYTYLYVLAQYGALFTLECLQAPPLKSHEILKPGR